MNVFGFEVDKGCGLVDGFGNIWDFGQVFFLEFIYQFGNLEGQSCVDVVDLVFENVGFMFWCWVIDIVVEVVLFEGVGEFLGVVGCQNDLWDVGCCDGFNFGNGDLIIGQDFQKKGFKFFVSVVDFVDQENWWFVLLDCSEEWMFQKVFFGKNCFFNGICVVVGVFVCFDCEQLVLVVLFVDGVGLVQFFIILQLDQVVVFQVCQCFGNFCFVDIGFVFQEQWLVQYFGQK